MRILGLLLGTLLSTGESPPPGTLTRAPELIELVPAEYPPEAERAGVEGTVVLSVVVGEDGTVRQAEVVDPGPHPALGPAALHAAAQLRFRPAEIDGVPAAVEISFRYDFVLRREVRTPAPEAPVALAGRIVERGTRTPVAGATVESQGVVAETGADGRFALRGVAPGDVVVRVVSPEHEPLSVTERLEEGAVREVEYRLSRRHYDPYEAVVRGERARGEATVRTLTTEEVRTIPGTQGDTLKVLQTLPGVARSPFGIGLLVVRGSEPSETLVYVDGVPIPQLFHFGAITSVVNADEVEGPIGSGSAYASLRRSWIDGVLAIVLPRVAPETADDLRVAPRYYDYQTKLTFPVLGGRGSVFAYGSDDLLTFVRDEDQPGRPTFKLSTLFHRVGASFRRPLGAATN